METNQIYSSMDENQLDGIMFVVDLEENETSQRLKLKGEYSLKIADSGISLHTIHTDKKLYHWPYTVLRRYGTSKTGFTFEAGRKSQTGPGVLRFASPSGKLITRSIKESVSRIRGDNPIPNSDQTNIGSSLNSHSYNELMTGDYTEYSRTTGRPNRARARAPEPNRELSLEIPGNYMNSNRLAAPNVTQSVSLASQQTPRMVSPYYTSSLDTQLVSEVNQGRSNYNTVGNKTILVDSYSEVSSLPSPLTPTFVNTNQSVPLPSPRVKTPNILKTNPFSYSSPSIPLPYNSIKRAKPKSLDMSRSTEMLHKSSDSPGTTFPTCVSPLPDSGEDSSGEESETKTSRNISQVCTSVNELIENLQLTPVHNTECEDYVNLNRNQLIKTVSNPLERIDPITSHSYMNVSRTETKDDSDYYNITNDLLLEERKRSNTDTEAKIHEFRLDEDSDFNFTLTHGPASFSGIQDTLSPVDEEMVYGNVQFHPSSANQQTDHLYVNTATKLKPVMHNLREHKSLESLNTELPSFVSQTLPPSPTKNSLIASNSQPSTIKIKSRASKEKPINSQYSFLAEILGTDSKFRSGKV